MKIMNNLEIYERLKLQSFNSSHFVWLWSNLSFVQSKNGWVFAYIKKLGVLLIALEPLPPLDTQFRNLAELSEALTELANLEKSTLISFVGIYGEFGKMVAELGYTSLQIGKEPWINLKKDIKPTGHAGRKVRVAINQATKDGLTVEEWSLSEVIKFPEKLKQMEDIRREWEEQSLISLSGFLHGISFTEIADDRKCFLAISAKNEIEGVLIVSPIAFKKSWYFEDTLVKNQLNSSRGIGEILTQTALESLQAQSFEEVSLGIVPMTVVGTSNFDEGPPKSFLRSVALFQNFMGLFYNSNGMELFRKRFKINSWDPIFVAINSINKSTTFFDWCKTFLAISLAYQPKIQFNPSYLTQQIMGPIIRYFNSLCILSIYFIGHVFVFQNPYSFSHIHFWGWPLEMLKSDFYFSKISILLFAYIILKIEKEVFARKWVWFSLIFLIGTEFLISMLYGIVHQKILADANLSEISQNLIKEGNWDLLAGLFGFSTIFVGNKRDQLLNWGLMIGVVGFIVAPLFHLSSSLILIALLFYFIGHAFGKFYLQKQSDNDLQITKTKSN